MEGFVWTCPELYLFNCLHSQAEDRIEALAWPHQTHLTHVFFALANESPFSFRNTLLATKEILNAKALNPPLYYIIRDNYVISYILPAVFHIFHVLIENVFAEPQKFQKLHRLKSIQSGSLI